MPRREGRGLRRAQRRCSRDRAASSPIVMSAWPPADITERFTWRRATLRAGIVEGGLVPQANLNRERPPVKLHDCLRRRSRDLQREFGWLGSQSPEQDASYRASGKVVQAPWAWPPDGTKLAYYGDVYDSDSQNSNYDIYVMNDDGSDRVNLSQGTADRARSTDQSYPAWSPDGSRIGTQRRSH